MLNSRTDCFALAKEVIYQCDLIHHSRISEVEQTIYYLKKRKLSHATSASARGGGKAFKYDIFGHLVKRKSKLVEKKIKNVI